MAFNPPVGVANGATYGYGNMVWEYAASSGVWNIVGGSLIGAVGPQGPAGPAGSADIKLATNSITGVASFRPYDFDVSVTGNVSLTNDIARRATRNTFLVSNEFLNGLDSTTITTPFIFPYGETDAVLGSIAITSADGGAIQINSKSIVLGIEQKNGGSPAFIDLNNDAAGPSIEIGAQTGSGLGKMELHPSGLVLGGSVYATPLMITGGVFRNPTEFAPHFTTTSNDLIVNGISGSIQRFTITPTGKVTIKAGTGWHSLTAATETISLIIQNKSSHTGAFDSSILTDGSGSPILFGPDTVSNFGVVGGVSVLTLMRVNKGGGVGLTMGFVISTGMTAANITIN